MALPVPAAAPGCSQPGGRACPFWLQQKAAHFPAERAALCSRRFIFSKGDAGGSICLSLALLSQLDQNLGVDAGALFISSSWHASLGMYLKTWPMLHGRFCLDAFGGKYGDFHNQINEDIYHHQDSQQLYSSTSDTHFSYLVWEQLLLRGAGAGDLGCILVPAAPRGLAQQPPRSCSMRGLLNDQ